MAIRSTISNNSVKVDDNVIRLNAKANDDRGIVDPNSNPYEGSIADRRGLEQEFARSILMGAASITDKGLGVPSDLPVRDVLSFVRMPNNHGWGVETRYRQRVRSPLTGIRGFCVVTCQSGSAKAVSECDKVSCPFWGLRLGRNAHFGKKA